MNDSRGSRDLAADARRLADPVLRTARFLAPAPSRRRGQRYRDSGIPSLARSPGVAAQVAADELALTMFQLVRPAPSPAQVVRISGEMDDALTLYDERGWLRDPASYHQAPPPLRAPDIRPSRDGLERLRFASDWAPHPHEPGRERWLRYRPNHIARALVLRHPDGLPRPWVVCVHGTEMGRARIDPRIFRVRRLHEDLGCNVVLPLLPLHGPRHPAGQPDVHFPSIDIIENVHGLAQSAWDVRRLLTWVRAQEPTAVAITGLSLGGSVAALVAGLDAPLDCVIAGVPVADFPRVFRRSTPRELRETDVFEILDERADLLHRVVSPLRFDPATPVARRFMFAGLADRLLDPVEQAGALWEHWGQPDIHWFDGGHVGGVMRRDVARFIDASLQSSGLSR